MGVVICCFSVLFYALSVFCMPFVNILTGVYFVGDLTANLAAGLLKNKSAARSDVLIFVYNTAERCILRSDELDKEAAEKAEALEKAKQKPMRITARETYMLLPDPKRRIVQVDNMQGSTLTHMLGEMALFIFYRTISKGYVQALSAMFTFGWL